MANPQPNKFVRISTELLEALCRIRIPGEAMQTFLTIVRKTYGWRKKEDQISLSQFCLATNLKRNSVCRAVKKLRELNVIVHKKETTRGNKYRINKDFDTWKPFTKRSIHQKVTSLKGESTSHQKVNKLVTKRRHTIDIKDTSTKDRHFKYVFLSSGDLKKLEERYGKSNTGQFIENLNDYIGGRGLTKKYKNHYYVLNTWMRKAGIKPPVKAEGVSMPARIEPSAAEKEKIAKLIEGIKCQ